MPSVLCVDALVDTCAKQIGSRREYIPSVNSSLMGNNIQYKENI